jgi:hypothetical protein
MIDLDDDPVIDRSVKILKWFQGLLDLPQTELQRGSRIGAPGD